MASEHYTCEVKPSITHIEEGEMEQIGNSFYFVDVNNILNREIKEEATEFKLFNGYGVSNECLENNENGTFYDSSLGELGVMVRDSVEDPTESKFSPGDFCENKNLSDLAGESAKHRVNHFNNGVILKNEDQPERNDNWPTNNVKSKTKTLKTEDYNVIYYDVKPEICEEKSSEKCENGSCPNFSHGLLKDSETWPQQNIEESGTAVGKDNDTRTEPTINTQIIQKLPHYSKFHSTESEQEFNEIPHTGEKPFQCKICSKSFNKEGNLTTHKKLHVGKKPFQCKICSKSFSQKSDLTRHEGIHTGVKQYQCTFCAKLFFQKGYLAVHERIHKGEKPYECKICSKFFNQKGHLLRHEKSHAGAKPFHCRICSKSFTVKNSLLIHERLHTGEKPFQCNICPKSFNQKTDLTRHERIHTGEKPFQCKLCPKSFSYKGYLVVHEKIHTGGKPFQCEICSKSFTLKANLKMHELIHTEEKPYPCKTCAKSFIRKKQLATHEKIHEG